MSNIIAVDPGTSNCGMVYMSPYRVICAKTFHGPKVGFDQAALVERMGRIARAALDFAADKPHSAIVCESFIGYAGMQGGFTYQTPELVGYLARAWEHAGEEVVWQTSRQVLNPRSKGALVTRELVERHGRAGARGAALEASGWRDVGMCTNDHLRAAALHGVYYYRNGGEDGS